MTTTQHKPKVLAYIVLTTVILAMIGGFGSALEIGQGYLAAQKQLIADGFTYSQNQTDAIAHQIDEEMARQKRVVDTLAKQLTSGEVAYQNVIPAIEAAVAQMPNLFGVAVCFAPDVYPEKHLYGPYFALDQTGQHGFTQIEERYDYADAALPNALWYAQIARAGEAQWIRLYGTATQDWTVLYGAPFFKIDAASGEKTFAGVVVASHSVGTTLKVFMQSIDLGQEGYAVLITDDGVMAYHPRPALINQTLQAAAEQLGDTVLAQAAQRQLQGENFYVERQSANQVASWTSFRVLPTSHWTVTTVVYQNVRAISAEKTLTQLIHFGLALLIGALGLGVVSFRPDKGTRWRLWATSALSGALIMLCLFWIWYLAYTLSFEEKEVIVNYENVAATLAAIEDAGQFYSETPVQIPTGILIENINIFNTSAKLTGYLWQKYPLNMDEASIRAPRFPDAIVAPEFNAVYKFVRNGKLVIGWVFDVELSQRFNFHQYPLDEINIQLLIEPSDYTINALMMPDFAEYEFMSPSQEPGIKNDLAPVGWNVLGSGFTYVRETYNTTFGGLPNIYKNKYPVLAFNIL